MESTKIPKTPPAKEARAGDGSEGQPARFPPSWKGIVPVAFLAFLLSRFYPVLVSESITLFSSGPNRHIGLSSSYILCSAEGEQAVYAVDGTNAETECVAVDKAYVVGTGTLGVCLGGLVRGMEPTRMPQMPCRLDGLGQSFERLKAR